MDGAAHAPRRGVSLDLRRGAELSLQVPGGGTIRVTLEHKSGQSARLRVQAPAEVRISHEGREIPAMTTPG